MDKHRKRSEYLWENLLSRQPGLINEAFTSLDKDQRQAVLDHLQKMINQPGWQPEQRISAQAALDKLADLIV